MALLHSWSALLLLCAAVASNGEVYPPGLSACLAGSCSACVAAPGCGWCARTFTCMSGGPSGPSLPANYTTLPVPCDSSTPGGGPPVWVHSLNGRVCSHADGTDLAHPEWPGPPPEHDVLCKNGGQRYWDTGSPFGNHACRCPAGWSGLDCSQCLQDAVCPSASGMNKSCVSSVLPTYGSQLSRMNYFCKCVGAMAAFCNIGVTVPNGASFVVEYFAGARTGTIAAYSDTPNRLPDQLLSGVSFAGRLRNCVLSPRASCRSLNVPWVAGAACASMSCDAHDFNYPQPTSCLSQQGPTHACNDNDVCSSSWRWRACALGDLRAITRVLLECQYHDGVANGVSPYLCSFTAGYLGPFAVECRTSSCEYDSPLPPPPPPPVPPTAFGYAAVIAAFAVPVVFASACAISAAAVRTSRRTGGAVATRRVGVDYAGRSETGAADVHARLGAAADGGLSFEGLSLTTADGRVVLRGISGSAGVGNTLVLGPSGAGKSSLLDILAGRKYDRHVGSVRLNGKIASATVLRHNVGYVLQDDVMLGTMSVREHLEFVARLRLPAGLSAAEISGRVSDVLADLGLTAVADVRCGDEFLRGISGGERRRVGVAACMFTNARVLLIDEPTSGLDSTMAQSVVDCLIALGRRDRAVVMTMHQPRSDIWNCFDRVLVLSPRGHCLYFGPTRHCVPFFERFGPAMPAHFNAADYVMDVVGAMEDEAMLRAANESAVAVDAVPSYDGAAHTANDSVSPALTASVAEASGVGDRAAIATNEHVIALPGSESRAVQRYGEQPILTAMSRAVSRWLLEVLEIALRSSSNTLRHPLLCTMHITAAAGVALLVSFVYGSTPLNWAGIQNRMGFMFFTVTFFVMSALSAIPTWRSERLLFLRERASGCYCTSSYFVAKVVCDMIPLRVIPPVVYAAIVYWSLELNTSVASAVSFVWLLVMINFTATAICLAVGASVPSIGLANLLATLVLLFSLLFCGFMVSKIVIARNPFLVGVHAMSFLNYAFEALLVNEFAGQVFVYQPVGFPFSLPLAGRVVLDQLGMNADHFAFDVTMLGIILAAWLLIAYVVLRLVRERR